MNMHAFKGMRFNMEEDMKLIEFKNKLKELETDCLIRCDSKLANAISGKFITKNGKMYSYLYRYELSKTAYESEQRYIKFIKELYDTDFELVFDYFDNELSKTISSEGWNTIEVNINNIIKIINFNDINILTRVDQLFKAIEENDYEIFYLGERKNKANNTPNPLNDNEKIENIRKILNDDGYYTNANIFGYEVIFGENIENVTDNMIQFAIDIVESYCANPKKYDNEALETVLNYIEEDVNPNDILKQLGKPSIYIATENGASLNYSGVDEIGDHMPEVRIDRDLSVADVALNG